MRMTRIGASVLALLLWVGVASAVSIQTLASGVTTNTTTAAVMAGAGPISFYGEVVGTGTVTQTQAIYGDVNGDAANGILLCTLTLSGTTRAQDACPVVTAEFAYFYVVTTNTTGTGATGAVYGMYDGDQPMIRQF
jgi:hypothetical protein